MSRLNAEHDDIDRSTDEHDRRRTHFDHLQRAAQLIHDDHGDRFNVHIRSYVARIVNDGAVIRYNWCEFNDRAGVHRVVLYYPDERRVTDLGTPLSCPASCPYC